MVANDPRMSEASDDMIAVVRKGLDQIVDEGPGWWVTLNTPDGRIVEVWFSGNQSWSVNFPGGGKDVEDAREWIQTRELPVSLDNESAITLELSDHSRQAVTELVVAFLQSVGEESVSIDYIQSSESPSSEDESQDTSEEGAPLKGMSGMERLSAAGDMVDEERNLERAVSVLGEAFRTGNPDMSHIAGDYLEKAGAVAVPELVQTFEQSDDEFLLTAAIGRLAEIGEAARSAVPALIGLLDDSRSSVRYSAASALVDITDDEHADLVVPPLAEAIRNPPDDVGERPLLVRMSCVIELTKLGEKAAPAADALIWLLENENATEWERVINGLTAVALSHIGVHALPGLTEAYESGAEETRTSVTAALGGLGEEAIPLLRKALSDRSPKVRRMAATSAIQLRWKAVSLLPAMLAGLTDAAIRDGIATGFKVFVFEWED